MEALSSTAEVTLVSTTGTREDVRCRQRSGMFTKVFIFFHLFSKEMFNKAAFCYLFIGPESDHWECLSVTPSLTHSLTDCCLVNLIDVTLACEDANSKLVEVVTVADVDA